MQKKKRERETFLNSNGIKRIGVLGHSGFLGARIANDLKKKYRIKKINRNLSTNKKIVLDEKSIITLDSKHKEIEKEFEKEKYDIIPELRAKKRYFTKLLENNLPIEQELEVKDKILDINNQIKELKANKKKIYL